MNYFKCKQQYLKVNPSSNGMPMGRKYEKKLSTIFIEKKLIFLLKQSWLMTTSKATLRMILPSLYPKYVNTKHSGQKVKQICDKEMRFREHFCLLTRCFKYFCQQVWWL